MITKLRERRRQRRQVRELLEIGRIGAVGREFARSSSLESDDSLGKRWQRVLAQVESAQSDAAAPSGSPRPRVLQWNRRVFLPSGIAATVLSLIAGATIFLGTNPAVALEPFPDKCTDTLRQSKPGHVVVAAVWGGQERREFRRVLEQFEKDSGLEVTLAASGPDPDRDIGRTIHSLIDNNCAPDVVLLPQPGLLKDLARGDKLQPVGNAISQLVDQNYMRVWRDLATGDDNVLYGVWYRAANKSLLWFNSTAFARAHVEPPTDWDGLLRVARKLVSAGMTPFSIAGAENAGWTLSDWFENIYLRTAGPEKYDLLAQGKILWTDPSVTDALQRLGEIIRDANWIAGGRNGALKTTYEQSVEHVFGNVDRPDAAMVFGGNFVANEIAKTNAKLGVDARFFPFPSIGGRMPTLVGGEQVSRGEVGGDVAVLLKDRDEGRRLLEFLATPEAALPWAEAGGFLSPNKALDLAAYPDPATKEAARALRDARTVRFDLSDLQRTEFGSTPGQGMWEIFRYFLTNPDDVVGTAEKLERCSLAPPAQAESCHL